MLFNSLTYLWFFPSIIILFFLIPQRFKAALLLFASYYFYMCWKVEFIILIIISTTVDYFCGLKMGQKATRAERKKFLILSLLVNLGLLGSFKYLGFITSNINFLADSVNIIYQFPELKILIPVGISFYTFQTLSYTIEVYNGKIKPEKNFVIFGAYVAFFPQLVAGPIERASNLIPQFKTDKRLSYNNVVEGLKKIFAGYFKKMVIADRLAEFVNPIFENAESLDGFALIIGTLFFAFQIYCDFSGYSDIAIGSARILGFNLMENFRRPYLAKNIREFWTRWHISLSTWFKDYLYIPLGGNRVVKWRWYYNLIITFVISGLWHGANWTFIIWGAIHGVFYVLSINVFGRLFKLKKSTFTSILFILFTFIVVNFSWIFFRANNVSDAFSIVGKIFSFSYDPNLFFNYINNTQGLSMFKFIAAIVFISGLTLVEILIEKKELLIKLKSKKSLAFAGYAILFVVFILFAVFGSGNEFTYFQF